MRYDGMPKEQEKVEEELNQDEMIGFIMRATHNQGLTYEGVRSVLDAEEQFLIHKGYIDENYK